MPGVAPRPPAAQPGGQRGRRGRVGGGLATQLQHAGEGALHGGRDAWRGVRWLCCVRARASTKRERTPHVFIRHQCRVLMLSMTPGTPQHGAAGGQPEPHGP